jgi:fumarate hydratase class I
MQKGRTPINPVHRQGDGHAFRDLGLEEEIFKLTQDLGVGAQFGGVLYA